MKHPRNLFRSGSRIHQALNWSVSVCLFRIFDLNSLPLTGTGLAFSSFLHIIRSVYYTSLRYGVPVQKVV